MARVQSIGRAQVVGELDLRLMEEAIAQARAGVVTEIIMIAADAESRSIVHMGGFRDRWRMVGAIEHAKHIALTAEQSE